MLRCFKSLFANKFPVSPCILLYGVRRRIFPRRQNKNAPNGVFSYIAYNDCVADGRRGTDL